MKGVDMKKVRQIEKSEFEERITAAWLGGARSGYTRDQFKHHMLVIGLNVYEKQILPCEICGEYPASEPTQRVKVIPFPVRQIKQFPGSA